MIARRGSYHGNSRGALDVSGRQPLRVPYLPWLGQSVHVAAAYPYRDPTSGAQHAAALDATIREIGAEHVAAFVAEPIAGSRARGERASERLLVGGVRRCAVRTACCSSPTR